MSRAIFRLHDLAVDPNPPLPPSAGGASLILEAEVKIPDSEVSYDSGFRVITTPGITRPGRQRSRTEWRFDAIWGELPGASVEALMGFKRLVEGQAYPFHLSLEGQHIPPVAPFAGATLIGGVPLTPTSTLLSTSVVRLADDELVTFTRVRFAGELDVRNLTDRSHQTDQWFAVAVPLVVELPEWGS